MKKNQLVKLAIAAAMACISLSVYAVPIVALPEWAVNIDGAVADSLVPDPIPAAVNAAGFNAATGLGTIEVTLSGAGAHYVGLFVDHEIDEVVNTFFNEYGSTSGAAAAGQSWEIDEPGWVFGDIFTNLTASALDNSNGVPGLAPDDVSMALAWDYLLGALQISTVTFTVSDVAPLSGFYLVHTDPDSNASIYFSSALKIRSVPEPATALLLGAGLAVLTAVRRRRRAD